MPKHRPENDMDRVPSGISGLDKLISGGFIKNDVYLITGETGTGKTLFCCQFLWEGLKRGENCIFFSLEEMPEDVISDAEVFGWDFKKYIDQKKFFIEYEDPFKMIDITSLVKERIRKHNIKRVVIDSTSIFGMVFEQEHELRQRLYELIKAFKGTDAVVLMTSEISNSEHALSRFHVEEFVADGIIVLYYIGIGGQAGSSLEVRKMRRTDHARGYFSLEFTKKGLAVKGEGSSELMK